MVDEHIEPAQQSGPDPKQPAPPRESDGPHEVEDAARQEAEYPADETDEG